MRTGSVLNPRYPRLVIGTSARLLRLLSLLQARRTWTGAELAEQLEITERTLRRDVEKLRSLGYPVAATRGVAGGYRLGAGASLPPLLLEDDEAQAVALGLRSATSGNVRGMEEAALRALAKLEQVLPARLRKRVRAMHASVVTLPLVGPTVDAEKLTMLAGACRAQETVELDYEDMRGRESSRRLEPHGLVHSGPRWYLVAWDLDRDAFRTFRVDRIASRVRTGRRFVPRPIPGGDLARYVSRSISTEAYEHKARIVLHASRDDMARRIPPSIGRLTAMSGDRCLLETGAPNLEGLALHVAMLGVEHEVLEPAELVDAMKTAVARMRRAIGRSRGV